MNLRYLILFFSLIINKENLGILIHNLEITIPVLTTRVCSTSIRQIDIFFSGKAQPGAMIEFFPENGPSISTQANDSGDWRINVLGQSILGSDLTLKDIRITSTETNIFSIRVSSNQLNKAQMQKFFIQGATITADLELFTVEKLIFGGAYTARNPNFPCPCPSDSTFSFIKITRPETTIEHCIPPTFDDPDDVSWRFATDILASSPPLYKLNACISSFNATPECSFAKPVTALFFKMDSEVAPPRCVQPECVLTKAIINKYLLRN